MKLISNNLGRIIAALAALCLLITSVVYFKAPIGGFFANVVGKETTIGANVLDQVKSPALPVIVEGNGSVFSTVTPTTLSFRSTAELSEFKEVKVDGAIVDPSNYTLTEGSTIVTFTNDYASSLSEGAHEIMIVSTSGSPKTTFSVTNTALENALSHNGVIPEGGTYTAANGTVYNAGDIMPSSVSVGDTYTYGDYKYSKSSLSLLEEFGYSSVDEFKANCETDLGMTWDECVAEFGTEEALSVNLLENYGWSTELNLNVTDKNQTSYGQILYSINNRIVDCLYNTFRDCRYMTTSPTIPSGVMALNRTFSGCSSLVTSPTMPNNLLTMNYSFYNCGSLVNAPVIPDSVVYMYNTFENCKSLVSVPAIPSSVVDMNYVFSGCISLVNAPDMSNASNVINMENTFYRCTSLATAPTIPSSVTNMGNTFDGCTSLTTAPTIPSSVISMACAFSNCTSLTGTIEINANPTSWSYCFNGTVKPITLTGSSTKLAELAATANNGNVTY